MEGMFQQNLRLTSSTVNWATQVLDYPIEITLCFVYAKIC
jgi:hypothetical protein